MKKITSKFIALLFMGTVLFSACKKDETAPAAESCSVTVANAAIKFQAKVQAFEDKVKANYLNYSKTECVALKSEGLTLLASAKACPELASNTELIASLQAQADGIECP